ncbi:MAG: insulinase family protein [Bacteroidia bacterium]|nr:insulinase family protein [Bacteroidia bacterium]
MTPLHPAFDRSRPPLCGTPKDVLFPDYFEHALSNGLRVLVYEQPGFPLATMQLVARGGASRDGDVPGLAAITSELLIKGTRRRSSHDIAEEIESRGGSIWSGAGWDSCVVGIGILSRHIPHAFDVLADTVRNPAFAEEEIERLKEQRLADILQDKSNPTVLAWHRFCGAVYGEHPYGRPQDGTEASLAVIDIERLRASHAERFSPSQCFLLVVGDASPAQIVALAEEHFGDWSVPTAEDAGSMPIPPLSGRQVHVVDRPTAVQSSIVVGHPGIARNSEDYIPVSLMNTLFGGYFGSRLNLNLREARGYTYGAHSRFDARMQQGPFAAGAEVRMEVTDLAIEEVLTEMRRMREEVIPEDELAKVQSYLTGSFPLQIETPSQVAQRIVTIELYGLSKTYYNHFNSTVLSLRPEDIQRVAVQYLNPDDAVIVAAGRGKQLRNTLERFGRVQVFDADGQVIPNISPIAQDV